MVLKLRDVHKAYAGAAGPVEVLRGVDLDLSQGQTLALTGESGSGKSTLLHIAGGLEAADRGEITVSDTSLTGLADAGRARLRRTEIGVVFQQFNLIPSLTVAANIAFQARLAGTADPAHIESLTTALGLSAHRDAYPEALSGGQQQRVAIARALAAKPKLLLADEPTGNLDEATAQEVLAQLLRLVRETGAALLMVTHSRAIADQLQRRVHLSQGRLA